MMATPCSTAMVLCHGRIAKTVWPDPSGRRFLLPDPVQPLPITPHQHARSLMTNLARRYAVQVLRQANLAHRFRLVPSSTASIRTLHQNRSPKSGRPLPPTQTLPNTSRRCYRQPLGRIAVVARYWWPADVSVAGDHGQQLAFNREQQRPSGESPTWPLPLAAARDRVTKTHRSKRRRSANKAL